jgi:hypothetical protein
MLDALLIDLSQIGEPLDHTSVRVADDSPEAAARALPGFVFLAIFPFAPLPGAFKAHLGGGVVSLGSNRESTIRLRAPIKYQEHPNPIQSDGGLYWCGSAEAGDGVALGLGNAALPSRPNTNN